MAGFVYRGQLDGKDNPVTINVPIKNSATVAVGDAVYNDASGATRATGSTTILGIVAAIVDRDGIDLDTSPAAKHTGTWTSSTQTYVASGTNVTVDKVYVKLIVDHMALFYNDADGDFTNPIDLGMFVGNLNHNQIDESDTSATVGQFFVMKLDPDGDGDASKCIVKIAASQLLSYEPET